MAEEHVIKQAGPNLLRNRGSRGSDESVDYHRQMAGGSGEASPGHRGNFKTAERGERLQPVFKTISMQAERGLDGADFALQPGVIKAGAAARNTPWFEPGQRGENSGGGSAVGDSHLADSNQRRTAGSGFMGSFDADFERAACLCERHCRTLEEIARPRADATITHARQRR